MKMGKSGVWFSVHALGRAELAKLAQGIERLNYDVLWYPESVGYELLSLGGFLLGETDRLCLASGIANIYARDAFSAMAGQTRDTAGRVLCPAIAGDRAHGYSRYRWQGTGGPIREQEAAKREQLATTEFRVPERVVVKTLESPVATQPAKRVAENQTPDFPVDVLSLLSFAAVTANKPRRPWCLGSIPLN